MTVRKWLLTLGCAIPLVGVSAAPTLARGVISDPLPASVGVLRTAGADEARKQAEAWLQSAGKSDPATHKAFEAVWADAGKPVLDKVAATLALGDNDAARILAEARDAQAPAPMSVPAFVADEKKPAFYRANLGLAYAKALSARRVYEESLDALRVVKPEQVVDPAAYFFYRAVAEHALGLKADANRSIVGIMEDVSDAPERYKTVAELMYYDMLTWKDKSLGDIARKMDNIERRLELARGGPKTQKIQKEVVARLDELIKQLENQSNGGSSSNGGACPNGGQQPQGSGGAAQGSPMNDSNIATNGGPGNIEQRRLRGLAEQWGKLPQKERAKAMADLTRDMPPRHRELIENYFKKLAQSSPTP